MAIELDDEGDDIAWLERRFEFFRWTPEEELDTGIGCDAELEVFSLFSEGICFEDRLVFEEKEWPPIANTEWAESIDDSHCLEGELTRGIESTFDFDSFFGKISNIMDSREFRIDCFFEFSESGCLDREARSLSMSSETDEVFLTGFEELDDTTPLRRPTGCDGEECRIERFIPEWNVHRSSISFSTRERMIVSILEDDRGLVVHLSELACYQSDNPMFEIMSIIDQYRFRGIDILECLLEMVFGRSFSCLIQMFEFREQCISPSLACEEPLEGRERRIHAASGIDAWTDLEADDISVIIPELLSSFEKTSKSMRARLDHLGETE